MSPLLLRTAAVLLALGTLGHTLGGMLGTDRNGPGAGPEADRVLAEMRAVRFTWRGADVSWHGFWLGNGLGVSVLLVPGVVLLWVLAGLDAATAQALAPVSWTLVASLAALGALGFRWFSPKVGWAFSVIAALAAAGVATIGR